MPGKARWDAEVLLPGSGLTAIPGLLPGGNRLEPKRRAVVAVSVQLGMGVDLRREGIILAVAHRASAADGHRNGRAEPLGMGQKTSAVFWRRTRSSRPFRTASRYFDCMGLSII